eukprot:jgi/Tetstr1/447577/TSEL_034955.t1
MVAASLASVWPLRGASLQSHAVEAGEEDDTCVRVALRARPLVAKERAERASMCILADEEHSRISLGNQRIFTFDHVFGPQSSQAELYSRCVEPLVQGCFAGYNATVLAYGQTGSGKTHTMGTGNNASLPIDQHGVIPRVIRTIFQGIHDKRAETRFTVRCQFVEVYNESIRDLLRPDTPSGMLQIRERGDGDIFVAGACEEVAMGYEECLRLLDIGSVGRVTGETNMNQQSSRSHAIFSIIMQQHPLAAAEAGKAEVVTSKLHLVDLAGSERVKKSNAAGERLKETVTINQGLLALGNVISALGDERRRATHVPYRDSKITRMLQDSLGGNSRTLMIATVSTSDSCIDESINTLKYANRARNIRNKPIVNVGLSSVQAMQHEIESMQLQLLRQQLEKPGGGGLQDGVLGGLTDAEREQLIEALGGGGRGAEGEVAALRGQVESLREELAATKASLHQAQAASAATSRSLQDLVEQNTALQMQADWQQEKFDAMVALSHEMQRAGQIPASVRDRLVEIATMAAAPPEAADSRPQTGDGAAGGARQRPASAALGRLQSARQARWQAKQGAGGTGGALASRQVPAGLEQQMEELRRMAEAARGSAAVAEQRAEAAEAEAAAAKAALQQAQDDLGRDEVIFAEKLAEMRGLEQDKDSIMLQQTETGGAPEGGPGGAAQRGAGPPSRSADGAQWEGVAESADSQLRASSAASAAETLEDQDDVMIGEDAEEVAAAGEMEEQVMAKQEEVEAATREFEASRAGLEAQLRELEHNIGAKEELIARLAENEQQQRQLAAQYEARLAALQGEVAEREAKVEELRAALEALDSDRAKSEEERQRLRDEYEAKLARMQEQLAAVRAQLKEADAAKMAKERARSKAKVESLEREVDAMRNTQVEVRRKAKEAGREAEVRLMALKKEQAALRHELEDARRRVHVLEADNERQRGAIKKSADQAARAAREAKEAKLRSAPSESWGRALLSRATTPRGAPVSKAQGAADLVQVKAELDAKMRAVSAKREAEEKLKGLQKKRVLLAAQRDAQAKQRNQLELRRIRASQAIGNHIKEMSLAMMELEAELEPLRARAAEEGPASRAAGEVAALSEQLKSATARRDALQARLQAQDFLPPEEEASMREMDDAIDALDAELEYLAEESSKAAAAVADGADAAESFQQRTQELGLADARGLLAQYMETLVSGRERERSNAAKVAEAEVAAAEASREAQEANYRLRQKEMEFDRRLTELQRDHADKVSALLKQAGYSAGGNTAAAPADGAASRRASSGAGPTDAASLDSAELQRLVRFYKEQMEALSKDNYYYRKLNKELKRKFRDEIGSSRASTVMSASQSLGLSVTLPLSQPQLPSRPPEASARSVADAPAPARPDTAPSKPPRQAADPDGNSRCAAPSSASPAVAAGSQPVPTSPAAPPSDGGAADAVASSRARMMAELSNYKSRMKRASSGSPVTSPAASASASLRSRALAASGAGNAVVSSLGRLQDAVGKVQPELPPADARPPTTDTDPDD